MRSGGTAFILPVLCQREVAQITEHRARAFACCVFVQSLVARTFVCVFVYGCVRWRERSPNKL